MAGIVNTSAKEIWGKDRVLWVHTVFSSWFCLINFTPSWSEISRCFKAVTLHSLQKAGEPGRVQMLKSCLGYYRQRVPRNGSQFKWKDILSGDPRDLCFLRYMKKTHINFTGQKRQMVLSNSETILRLIKILLKPMEILSLISVQVGSSPWFKTMWLHLQKINNT